MAASDVLDKWKAKGIKDENLAITLIDLSKGREPFGQANFRGNVAIYPASVVKMFYLAAAHRQLEDGELKDTPELRRAMRDMIVDSSNDATHYMVDALTGTSSGVELPEAEMKAWAYKRNRMNRYFAALGYENININQKTYCEDAYGRERVFRGAKGENRNRITTDATARLLTEIVLGKAVTQARSREMMELLKRDPYGQFTDLDDQSIGFTGRALNGRLNDVATPGARLWSKAGWTSTTRHDAAYIELPNGKRFVLVTYTTNQSKETGIIPTVARTVINHFNTPAQSAR
jgi:beta-lactamase class A